MSTFESEKHLSRAFWSRLVSDEDWVGMGEHKQAELVEDLNALAEDAVNYWLENEEAPYLTDEEVQ